MVGTVVRACAAAALLVVCASPTGAMAAPAKDCSAPGAAPRCPLPLDLGPAIGDMRVLLIGSQTGLLHELTQADGFAKLRRPGRGREAADSYLVDVKLEGPRDSRWPDADFSVEVYSVLDGRVGERDSRLIAQRKVKDIAFGADGVRQEDVFVDGGLCGQIAVYAEIQRPTFFGAKALMPFECGR